MHGTARESEKTGRILTQGRREAGTQSKTRKDDRRGKRAKGRGFGIDCVKCKGRGDPAHTKEYDYKGVWN